MVTLLRAVIDATGLSRRRAFAAIRDGRVTIDGVSVTDPSRPFEGGALALNGAALAQRPPEKVYLLLNKPPGFVSTRSDERGRATVLDLVPAELRAPGLHPAGRLDRETSGLLILTDDGDLTFRLTHPRNEIAKEYWVGLVRPPPAEMLAALRRGVEIDGGRRRPLALEVLPNAAPFHLSITLGEGRKRQVRRMCEGVGLRVKHLRRVREGPLRLGPLPEGAVRRLTPTEVAALLGDAQLR